MPPTQAAVDAFLARWSGASGSELANYQLFLTELIALLDLPCPEPASEDTRDNAYVFERRVQFVHGDGSSSLGRIDLYRRGHFVCEAKKVKAGAHTRGFDLALMRARSQAEEYARALPADEGRPPFLIVVDVGHTLDLYAEFLRSGATYTPFPDPSSHRIRLADLGKPEVVERLRAIWLEPLSLDPSKVAARVTRAIAADLAELARSLESAGHDAELVAGFLTRCLFTLFAEDVELLPAGSFTGLLGDCERHPAQFVPMLAQLWREMDSGGFSVALRTDLLRFNGKLFKQPQVLPLDREQIRLLVRAARHDWQHVEPAIFGTLLERALDPTERHALGAHYTPRAYVERLVLPTVIEPLRGDWKTAQAAALTLLAEGDARGAIAAVRAFHHQLCSVRVLDPACGSGNFLYVTLEHLKRLEGEVLNRLGEMGDTQGLLDLSGVSVDPHQFLGIEINPRAATIAEMVLWIGHLQWHFRTRGHVAPPQPVLKDFHNIECRDAVLAHDGAELVTDEHGKPVTRWDGRTMKAHPVTGEPVPDDRARVPLYRYRNPRKAEWPEADFVVGNPPFIGNKRMRNALGDGYVEALRAAWTDVPDSADFVMYWWDHAGELTRAGSLRQFGLITTNSIRQAFNRRVLERHMETKDSPLSLVFAVPDHPWVDAADGAAVRIAMTVAQAGQTVAVLREVTDELDSSEDEVSVILREKRGMMFPDLKVGANVAGAMPLRANSLVSNRGVIPHGEGMVVTDEQAIALGLGRVPGLESRLRPYRNGRDLAQSARMVRVIDMFGLSAEQVRERFPEVFQWLLQRVKPERDQNPRASRRENWWLFGENQPKMRAACAGLRRYLATVQTSKHRFFTFLDAAILPDDKLIAIGHDDAGLLGVLSSRVHLTWALATGATLEDRPVYNKSTCFECFPFPAFHSDPHPSGAARQPPSPVGRGFEGEDAVATHPSGAVRQPPSPGGRGLQGDDAAVALSPSPTGRRWPIGPDEGAPESPRTHRKPGLPPSLLAFARQLRQRQTDAETRLWFLLRDRRFLGLKFRRQAPMPPFILDFYCHELRLAVELDGGQHNAGENREKDAARTRALAARGVLVLRFWNDAFLRDIESALEALYAAVQDRRVELGIAEAPSSGPSGHLLAVGEDHAQAPSSGPSGCFLPVGEDNAGLKSRIRGLAEQLDAHRKRQQAAHPDLTLTGIYNVLEKLRSGEALNAKEKLIHEHGLVSVLKQLHDDLDLAVLAAYGWQDLAALMQAVNGNAAHPEGRSREEAVREMDEALLERLVALNAERAAEEARSLIRWLRPEFQNPGAQAPAQAEIETASEESDQATPTTPAAKRQPWPKELTKQVRAVADAVASAAAPLPEDAIAERFVGRSRWRERLPRILDMLVALGHLRRTDGGYRRA